MSKLKFQVATSTGKRTTTVARHIVEMNELLVAYKLQDYIATINYFDGYVLSIVNEDGVTITNKLIGLDEERFKFIHKILHDMNDSNDLRKDRNWY